MVTQVDSIMTIGIDDSVRRNYGMWSMMAFSR